MANIRQVSEEIGRNLGGVVENGYVAVDFVFGTRTQHSGLRYGSGKIWDFLTLLTSGLALSADREGWSL